MSKQQKLVYWKGPDIKGAIDGFNKTVETHGYKVLSFRTHIETDTTTSYRTVVVGLVEFDNDGPMVPA